MAGNKNSGRPKINEGATKYKNNILHVRKNGKWVAEPEKKISDDQNEIHNHSTEPEPVGRVEGKDDLDEGSEGSGGGGHGIRGDNKGNRSDSEGEPVEVDVFRSFDKMREIHGSEGALQVSEVEEEESESSEDSQQVNIKGKHLLFLLDLVGSRVSGFLVKRFLKSGQTHGDFKLDNDEKEELEEAAEAAAKTINFKAAGNPWLALLISWLLLTILKVDFEKK